MNYKLDFLLCLLFGYFGVHKFYEKKIGMGILYIFTLGLLGFGWIYDTIKLFLIAFVNIDNTNKITKEGEELTEQQLQEKKLEEAERIAERYKLKSLKRNSKLIKRDEKQRQCVVRKAENKEKMLIKAEKKEEVRREQHIAENREKSAQRIRIEDRRAEGSVCCPKCGSTSLTANKKGFSLGKAIVGGLVLVPVAGVATGMIGKNKVIITCLNCGKQFKPGKR